MVTFRLWLFESQGSTKGNKSILPKDVTTPAEPAEVKPTPVK